MKTKINSRGLNDTKWAQLKIDCKIRDNYECQLCNCLTAAEYNKTKKLYPTTLLKPTDVAHIEAVGYAPNMIYDLNNVMFLCRAHHTSLDNLIDPLTGLHMDNNKRWYWWYRSKYKNTIPFDNNIDWYSYFYEYKQKQLNDCNKTVVEKYW